jgi:hypothetical protein
VLKSLFAIACRSFEKAFPQPSVVKATMKKLNPSVYQLFFTNSFFTSNATFCRGFPLFEKDFRPKLLADCPGVESSSCNGTTRHGGLGSLGRCLPSRRFLGSPGVP